VERERRAAHRASLSGMKIRRTTRASMQRAQRRQAESAVLIRRADVVMAAATEHLLRWPPGRGRADAPEGAATDAMPSARK